MQADRDLNNPSDKEAAAEGGQLRIIGIDGTVCNALLTDTEIWEKHRHEAPLGYYIGRIFTEFQFSDRSTVRSCTGWRMMYNLVLSSLRARDF